MTNKSIFVACDTSSLKEIKKIINNTKTTKLQIIPKFGLQFFYSKNGRAFLQNFKKDLEKVVSIILNEIKLALKRGDRVELRGFGIFSSNIQKARISRNPKTGEKVNTPQKKTIHFKMAKEMFKKLNNDE